uniref:Uncharacterized protein n=1 Tax=Salmo trutta TaxID=8032 RepID=A0A674EDQ8_SALTR
MSGSGEDQDSHQPIISFLSGQFQVVGGIVSTVRDGYSKQGLVLAEHHIGMAGTAELILGQQPYWTETVFTMRCTTLGLYRAVFIVLLNSPPASRLPASPLQKIGFRAFT